MKPFRRVLISVLLLTVILCGVALALHYAHALPFLSGPAEVSVHGKVTRDGKPLVWEGEQPIFSVIFFPEVRDTTTPIYPATCNLADGTFTIAKIPTGTYKVSVQQIANPLKDLLNFAYDPAHTTLKFDVTQDAQEINIDLPKDLPRASPPAMPKGRPDGVPGNGKGKGKGKDKDKDKDKEKPKSPDDDKAEPK